MRFNIGIKGGTVMAKNEYYIWHPVEEFPQSQYEINKMGQVRNTKSGQILNGSINKDGYLAYVLTVEGKVYRRFAHIMVAKQFLPNPDGLPVVNHMKALLLSDGPLYHPQNNCNCFYPLKY